MFTYTRYAIWNRYTYHVRATSERISSDARHCIPFRTHGRNFHIRIRTSADTANVARAISVRGERQSLGIHDGRKLRLIGCFHILIRYNFTQIDHFTIRIRDDQLAINDLNLLNTYAVFTFVTLVAFISLFALRTLLTLGALCASVTLFALLALGALCAGVTLFALLALGALCAGVTLFALFALGALCAGVTLFALLTLGALCAGVTLFALLALGALCAGVTLFALFALGALCAGVTLFALLTLGAGESRSASAEAHGYRQ